MTSQLTTSGLLRLIGLAGIVTILFGSIVGHERILETSKGLLDSPLRQVRLASLPSFGKSWLRQPAINVSQIYVSLKPSTSILPFPSHQSKTMHTVCRFGRPSS